jgi:predicted site-specific integrase-resolvase
MALVKIGKAAKMLGVASQTLLAWERSGELVPARRSQGGVRYYDLARIMGAGLGNEDLPTIGYARGSGPGREADLAWQEESLESFCIAKGWRHEIISDPTASLEGLKQLLELILHKRTCRLVITHKDRLLQFGSEIILTLCEIQNIEVIITHQGDDPPPFGKEELVQDTEFRRLCERRAPVISSDGKIKPNSASPGTSDVIGEPLPSSQPDVHSQDFDNPPPPRKPSGAADVQQLNEAALANLAAWVPALDLYRCRRTSQGYEAVATWRPSSGERENRKRNRNLKITPGVIRDLGAEQGVGQDYTPVELVMAARKCDLEAAFAFLDERLGRPTLASPGPAPAAALESKPETPKANGKEVDPAGGDARTDTGPEIGASGSASGIQSFGDRRHPDPPQHEPDCDVLGSVGDIADWIESIARLPDRELALAAALNVIGVLVGRLTEQAAQLAQSQRAPRCPATETIQALRRPMIKQLQTSLHETEKIISYIYRKGPVTVRKIQQHIRGSYCATEIRDMLKQYVEAGLIVETADGYAARNSNQSEKTR